MNPNKLNDHVSGWLILLLFCPLLLFSQKATFQFYSVEDGLISNDTWRVAQDQQGFLWVTNYYFSRFDGQQFLNKNNASHPIFTDFSNSLMESNGDLMVVYGQNRLHSFDPMTGAIKELPLEDVIPKALGHRDGCLKPGPNGKLILMVEDIQRDSNYFVWLEQGEIVSSFSFLRRLEYVEAIAAFDYDQRGDIYMGDEENAKIIKYDKAGNPLMEIPFKNQYEPKIIRGNGGNMFVLFNNRIMLLEKNADHLIPHPVNDLMQFDLLHDVLQLANGDLWIVGNDRQLFRYEASTGQLFDFRKQVKEVMPNQTALWQLYQDPTGTIWVTSIRGLLKVLPQRLPFRNYFTSSIEACEGHCSFRGFAEGDNGAVYASYYNNIFEITPSGKANLKPLVAGSHSPRDILFQDGSLLLNNGEVLNLETNIISNPYEVPWQAGDYGQLVKIGQDTIYLARLRSLLMLDLSASVPSWELIIKDTFEYIFTDLKYDSFNQFIWCSTLHGLHQFDEKSRSFKTFELDSTNLMSAVTCLYPNGKGGVWIGTYDGLMYFNPNNGEQRHYQNKDGLCHNFVNNVLPEGDSCLWISTNHGLSRMHIESEQFINFYEKDGLPGNEFNKGSAYKAADGTLYFGGTKGLTAFDPQEIMQKSGNRKTKGQLLGKSITMTDNEMDTVYIDLFVTGDREVEIFNKNKTVTIEFILSDYSAQGNPNYSYLLDGHHKIWSPPSPNNAVTFNSLPAGRYIFRVKALDAHGHWSSSELALPLRVYPPWWATWWAYIAYVTILMGLGKLIYDSLKRRMSLQNQLLLEQQEANRLKELDTFKSRLYTNLTHEFRTPLTVILGMVEEGRTFTKGEIAGLSKNLDLIEQNGQKLLQLINQLLDLSKLENHSFQLNLQKGDINTFLQYLTNSYENFARSKGLDLRFESKVTSLVMDFDASQLQQIVTNLMSNAFKFTHAGGSVLISTSIVHQTVLSIAIKDTGIGIAAKELPHIFDRFYQVDGTTTRAGEGTGIGLAHSLELVKLMEGSLEVESELGQGSVFRICLPIRQAPDTPVYENPAVVSSIPLPGVSDLETIIGQHIKQTASEQLPELLIIEDNADVIFYLKTCLQPYYKMMTAVNGQLGIEKAIEKIPDIILSDVMMPVKDGFEVVHHLKNDQRTSHIPIVLLTAKADAPSKIKGLSKGADAYLPKPFDKEELLTTMNMMLANKRRLWQHFSEKRSTTMELIKVKEKTTVLEKETSVTVFQQEDEFIKQLRTIVEAHFADPQFALTRLCDILGMNRYQLNRKMKALTKESPSVFIRNYRLNKAKELLETTNRNVSEVTWAVGFKDLAHFSKKFQELYGYPPSALKK